MSPRPKTLAEALAALNARRTPLRIKGHTLTRWNSGAEDTYRNGRCECGQRIGTWTTSSRSITGAHQSHLWNVYLQPFKDKEPDK